ncbi:MAG: hypothetical protein KGI46_05125 [Alphaproteobacteria bacterium]|nr:hypothetical protein [Alphaproteobacteria bacterium]MDE1930318.1 hypothetical protein [Alphaproteobacteria bacterium]
MMTRLKSPNARVARWHAPSLSPDEAGAHRPSGQPSTPEPPPPAVEPAAPQVDETAIKAAAALEALRAEQAAAGYAEGLARGLEEGRAQGHSEGLDTGRRAAEVEAAAAAGRVAKVLAALGGEISVLDDAVEDAVVALALELARRIVGVEVTRNRAALGGLIQQVLGEIPIDTGTPRILLHPDDLAALRTQVPDLGSGKVELVADDSMEAGGCRVLADGIDNATRPDRRWIERSMLFEGDLTLAARWRAAMLALFD